MTKNKNQRTLRNAIFKVFSVVPDEDIISQLSENQTGTICLEDTPVDYVKPDQDTIGYLKERGYRHYYDNETGFHYIMKPLRYFVLYYILLFYLFTAIFSFGMFGLAVSRQSFTTVGPVLIAECLLFIIVFAIHQNLTDDLRQALTTSELKKEYDYYTEIYN